MRAATSSSSSSSNQSIAAAIKTAKESVSALSLSSSSDNEQEQKQNHLTYYSAWFCPFAHRATLALERHRSHLSYDWIESLGWEKRSKTKEEILTQHENWYHFKHPELMAANPLGMVPTLKDCHGNIITESIVAIQYIDELVTATSTSTSTVDVFVEPIVAPTPYERAQERVMADYVAKTICSKYYSVLVRQDEHEQLEAFHDIEVAIEKFATHLSDNDTAATPSSNENQGSTGTGGGPFFNNRTTPGLVDFTLFPWAWRLPVFETHRDSRFQIDPTKSPGMKKYSQWLDAMCAREEVARTLPNWDEYLQHITRYADGSARSKVANAVRDGRSAHEYDDEKDDVKDWVDKL